jgi:hypothetical protein
MAFEKFGYYVPKTGYTIPRIRANTTNAIFTTTTTTATVLYQVDFLQSI